VEHNSGGRFRWQFPNFETTQVRRAGQVYVSVLLMSFLLSSYVRIRIVKHKRASRTPVFLFLEPSFFRLSRVHLFSVCPVRRVELFEGNTHTGFLTLVLQCVLCVRIPTETLRWSQALCLFSRVLFARITTVCSNVDRIYHILYLPYIHTYLHRVCVATSSTCSAAPTMRCSSGRADRRHTRHSVLFSM
jgi:hypothetical protein